MNVTQEVILDLLPLYLAGEASPATRALVEEYLQRDPELAQRIRLNWAENFSKALPTVLPPDLELRSLRRTRRLLSGQRWLFGFGITFTSLALSLRFAWRDGHFEEVRLLAFDYPRELGVLLGLALACWTGYFLLRRRLRTGATKS